MTMLLSKGRSKPSPSADLVSDARAARRNRRALLVGSSTAAARALQIATSLVAIPFAVRYLGSERFGLWMTINSLLAIIGFADFGLGNGLLNTVAHAYGEGKPDEARRAISSALVALLAVSCLLSLVFSVSYPLINWVHFFNVHSPAARAEAGPSVAVFFWCFALSLPLGVVQRIQLACQDGFLNGIWSSAGSLLGLFGLLLAIHNRMGLPWLIGAIVGAPALMLALNTIVLFGTRPELRPGWTAYSSRMSNRILKAGFLFFILQVAMAVGYQTDNLILAHILGPESVTQYAVPLRLFQCIPTFLGFFMLALWPAYSEAAARRDTQWILRTYSRSSVLNLAIGIPAALFLLFTTRTIVHHWVGNTVRPGRLLLVGLAGYCIATTIIGPVSALLNGLHILGFQAICWSVMAIVNLFLSIILTKSIGISGVVFGSLIAQVLFIIIPSFAYIPRCLRRLEHQSPLETFE